MERLFSFTPGQVATVSRSAYACKTDREKEKKEEKKGCTCRIPLLDRKLKGFK